MNPAIPTPPTLRYLPILVPVTGTVEHSSRKLLIATQENPDRVCGYALRVGYAGTLRTDLALYRLRVKSHPELSANTLSDFFVLEDGVFHVYE